MTLLNDKSTGLPICTAASRPAGVGHTEVPHEKDRETGPNPAFPPPISVKLQDNDYYQHIHCLTPGSAPSAYPVCYNRWRDRLPNNT